MNKELLEWLKEMNLVFIGAFLGLAMVYNSIDFTIGRNISWVAFFFSVCVYFFYIKKRV